MGMQIRPVVDHEVPRFDAAMQLGFGADAVPAGTDRLRQIMPLERMLGAFDGDEVVGTLGDFALKVTVPGGRAIPMAGTTMVTVRNTHRRRGILRQMMERHMADAARRGDPLAGLWASEAAIYGRFGYGLTSESHELKFDARLTQLAQAPAGVDLSLVSTDRLVDIVMPFWSAMAPRRAGYIDRDRARWEAIAADPEHRRDGASALRPVVATVDGAVVGYLSYRQTRKWTDGVPEGSIAIEDFVAAGIDASRALWNYVAHIDLFPHVSFGNAPLDDPFIWDVTDQRHVRRLPIDTLYVRILDPIAALAARTYVDGSIVMRVHDNLGYADGTYCLAVDDGVATVSPTDADADVTIDVRELGSLYLGGVSAIQLGHIGRIDGSAPAITLLDRLFRTAAPPWCPEMF